MDIHKGGARVVTSGNMPVVMVLKLGKCGFTTFYNQPQFMVIHLDYNYGNYDQNNDLWVSLKMEAPVNHQILGYIFLDTPIW